MLNSITSNLLWSQGFYIILSLAISGLFGLLFFRPIFFISLLFFAFSFYFFRNPERVCAQALHDPSVIICPADGTVVDIQYKTTQDLEGYAQKVSIFLSPIDVHVNWVPAKACVEDVNYKPGEFVAAFLPKSSLLNEHNDLILRCENNKTILVRQIAGTVARRICCWVSKNQSLQAGQKYGMIRFGSRVDILLPDEVALSVGIGQKVLGGQTILGRWQ
jgi:phosphatidylserine decarboxylase